MTPTELLNHKIPFVVDISDLNRMISTRAIRFNIFISIICVIFIA
jgi:hypothetical protein